ncbi:PH domain-containing protein [Cellulomonas fimi]|uniref:Membrane-flanked domain protein n=1 Tax=Cellulomonas fimi (strain ATCC 484 / DSM 20113 / JCM 1341 / CCUG 24087 / LMG 16345 / NBRC 15513 / NCIMB 8980 / NCTC 7547 / NRS-133) TaxID=590998 RepID=F4GY40_CELFA|nr:PH domain-containing protein [Cellulomonas fimi]AEE44708.1 membrane-flanked domain protein [Cellulomonas fimi ATCC 484]NNH06149.1 PH domain-containing protein [Cellulomonas fimi]VEH27069.1 Bacterial membrane flanked domain [Cellulomonas fimi]
MEVTEETVARAATGDLFDPLGVTWTRVSPKLAAARLTVTAISLLPFLAATVLLAVLVDAAWLWVFPAAVAALGLWIGLLVPRQVGALAYAERADDLLVRRGILFRQLVVVPYGRMQYVDVTAGPLARRFGIASVQLHTASPSTTASIEGLPPQEAARLRDRLASRGEARLAGL